MADKKYIYSGPLTGVTLAPDEPGGKPREVMLHPGRTVSLPSDNHYVKSLLARKFLAEVQEETTLTPPGGKAAPSPDKGRAGEGLDKEVKPNAS